MKLEKIHWIGICIGFLIIIIDIIAFRGPAQRNLFTFILGLGFSAFVLPFVIGIISENKREAQIAEMFLEFARNLSESVNTGTPISKSITNMSNKNYGALTPYIQKLANQISIGIPVNEALQTFAYEVDNPVITRAITLIREAEKAGGEIEHILESAARSIAEVEKLKKERKAAISSLIVQGYIIFFIFIGIMLVMEFKILPLVGGVGTYGGFGTDFSNFGDKAQEIATGAQQQKSNIQDLSNPFLYLLLAQGLFAGLTIGKLTEGSLKAGVKHSFIMTISAFLISTGVRLIFAG